MFSDNQLLLGNKFPNRVPTGRHVIAQGATLGSVDFIAQALKGRNNSCSFISPFQGCYFSLEPTQGCTLGYYISLRWSFVRKHFS